MIESGRAGTVLVAMGVLVGLLTGVPTASIAAVEEPLPGPVPTTVTSGANTSLFIGADHQLWGMGPGTEGELGSGPVATTATPRVVDGLPPGVRPISVVAVYRNTLVLGSDGRAYGTGSNDTFMFSAVADGPFDPAPVRGLTEIPGIDYSTGVTVTAIAQDGNCAQALTSSGAVYVSGGNDNGSCPRGYDPSPHGHWIARNDLPSGRTAIDIAMGQGFTLIRFDDGQVWASGNNGQGQLTGTGHKATLAPMTGLPAGIRAVEIAGGAYHSLVLGEDGLVYGSGDNSSRQLGDAGANRSTLTQLPMPIGTAATAIAAGVFDSVIVSGDRQVYGAGSNGFGELTGVDSPALLRPLELPVDFSPGEASASYNARLLRGDNGRVWAVGSASGALITGTSRRTFELIMGQPLARWSSSPVITGTAKYGGKLTVSTLGAPQGTTVARQWIRDGVPVPGATGPTYSVRKADQGRFFSVRLTAGVPGTTGTFLPVGVTTATRRVSPQVFNVARPTVTGAWGVGRTLRAKRGTWNVAATSWRMRWYRGSTQIKGATGPRYRLTKRDRGRSISVRVTVSRRGYISGVATSIKRKAW